MTSHSPLPVGAIKTRVLILLIVLIIAGVAGTVIFTHFLRAERKPDEATTTSPAQANLPPGMTSAANTVETAHHVIASNTTPEQIVLVAQTIENLYAACTACFSGEIKLGANAPSTAAIVPGK